jgi:hypothetical protein
MVGTESAAGTAGGINQGKEFVMKPLPITTENAIIKTASVEVKVLTISGRQLTLAVFRQIPEGQIITDDLKLAGTPWGIVRYCTKDCSSLSHLHVVWQDGQTLKRSGTSENVSPFYFLNLEFPPRRLDDGVMRFKLRFREDVKDFTVADAYSSYLRDRLSGFVLQKEEREFLEKRVAPVYKSCLEKVQSYNALYRQLANLDQLFIAI